MNLTHLHLILNHLPIFGIIFGLPVLVWGVIRRIDEIQKIGLLILFISSLAAVPVYLTGESASNTVEHLPGVSDLLIEAHEDAAFFALALCIVTGLLAIVVLVARRFLSKRVGWMLIYAVMLMSVITGASMIYTTTLGGRIRHTEIRPDQTSPPLTAR